MLLDLDFLAELVDLVVMWVAVEAVPVVPDLLGLVLLLDRVV
jgi:hypothetical protein